MIGAFRTIWTAFLKGVMTVLPHVLFGFDGSKLVPFSAFAPTCIAIFSNSRTNVLSAAVTFSFGGSNADNPFQD